MNSLKECMDYARARPGRINYGSAGNGGISRMVAQGADPAFLGSDDFAKFLNAEMPRWADAVKKSGAKLD